MEIANTRELKLIRIFKYPLGLMWKMWTDPLHLMQWWGPEGFSNADCNMDFQEGGQWVFTMIGPDGTRYPNKSIFRRILPLHKIVFEHFNPHFITTVLFESREEETQINWTLLFDTTEMREIMINAHKADEGQKQNLEKLDKYLSHLSFKKSSEY